MNNTTLSKIAAATSIIIDEFGGSVNVLPLMKALYLADREMLKESGYTITGDNYAALKHGPILSGAYDLIKGKYSSASNFQVLWDEAFARKNHSISKKGEVKISKLSLSEIDMIKQKARLVNAIFNQGQLNTWIHGTCPEWRDPGNSSIPIEVSSMARGVGFSQEEAEEIESENSYMVSMGSFESPCGSLLMAR